MQQRLMEANPNSFRKLVASFLEVCFQCFLLPARPTIAVPAGMCGLPTRRQLAHTATLLPATLLQSLEAYPDMPPQGLWRTFYLLQSSHVLCTHWVLTFSVVDPHF